MTTTSSSTAGTFTIPFEEETQVAPPLAGMAEGEEAPIPEVPPKIGIMARGAIPLQPGAVKAVFRFKGTFMAELLKWDGWEYSDKDLEDIAELAANLGIMAPPWMQLVGLILALDGAKLVAWRTLKATGKLPSRKVVGETPPPEGR